MSARFEIVRGDSGWWARFVAANGRTVWTTETYSRKSGAETACMSIGGVFDWGGYCSLREDGLRIFHGGFYDTVPVRYIDERATS